MAHFANRKPIRHAEQTIRHAGCKITRGAWTWIVKDGRQIVAECDTLAEAEARAETWARARQIEAETAEAEAAERRAERMSEAAASMRYLGRSCVGFDEFGDPV